MGISNSLFLGIRATPPLEQVGWEVKVMKYPDFATTVAYMNAYTKLSFNAELGDIGAGSVTMNLEDPFWQTELWEGVYATDILEGGYVFQCWEDGVHIFDFFGSRIVEDLVNDDEEKTVTISGPGSAAALKRAQIFPPNFPNYKLGVNWSTNEPAMKLFHRLLKASQARGAIPYVKTSFTPVKDSSGKEWADLKKPSTIEIEYSRDLLTSLNMATGQDDTDPWNIRADWYMRPGFVLDVRQDFGAHLENEVIFFEGDIFDKTRDRDSENIKNYICVQDIEGGTALVNDKASKARWGHREHFDTSFRNLTDKVRRLKVANILLEMKKDEVSEWSVQVPYDRRTRRPFRDYNVGDWVSIAQFNGDKPSTKLPFRVMAISIDVGEEINVELTLQSLYESNQKKLQRQITKLITTDPLSGIKVPNPYEVPDDVPYPVIWDPKTRTFKADPSYKYNSGGGSGVFIQPIDPKQVPGTHVKIGDFWIDTSGTN